LRTLRADRHFESLNRQVSSLALVRMLGAARDELAHSRLIAALLDPRYHRNAVTMLSVFLSGISKQSRLEQHVAECLRVIAEAHWERVVVHRELFWIDVVVEITSVQGTVVVGIENKVDAGEQPQQIGRYQEALKRAYRDRTAVMVFLTPTGREPFTARVPSPVPAVAVGYELVLNAVKEARRRTIPRSRDERVLSEIAAHLEEDILGEPEVKTLVRQLWRTHGRALQLAMKHRPRLSDIR
jgi:hypothetical protein